LPVARGGIGFIKPLDSDLKPGRLSRKILEDNKNILYVQIRFCNAGSRCAIVFYVHTAAVISGDGLSAGEQTDL
jgi:hypothetical protein